MKPVAFAARSLRREFRHAELATLAAALVLAVAALCAVATLANRVERAIVASAAELIGGDLAIGASRELPPAFVEQATQRGLTTSHLADFPSVVFAGDASRLAEIRATDAAFPLRGVLAVRDAGGAERIVHGPPAGTVYAESAVLTALHVQVGNSLRVGGRDLIIGGEITRSPDSGNLFRLAPRVVMNLADAESIGLLAAGSRARHRLLLAGTQSAIDAYSEAIKAQLPAGAEITTVKEAQQNLAGAFERGGNFLRLAALLAALLSGVAVALAAQRFARRKREEVALLRCLGASRGEILLALLLELVLLALPACLLGLLAGLGLQEVVFVLAGDLLPGATPSIPWQPPLAAFAVGVAVLFGFALPPLLRLRDVEPMRVFRRDDSARAGRFDALYLLPLAVAAALIWLGAGDAQLALTLALGFAGVALLTLLLGLILLRFVRSGGARLSGALRFGLANLARRRALSLLQSGALALSLTAFALLAVVGPSLLANWREELPADTPNYFLINLQDDQRAPVQQQLSALGASNINVLPIAVGKLVAINGKAPKAEDFSRPPRGELDQRRNAPVVERTAAGGQSPAARPLVRRTVDRAGDFRRPDVGRHVQAEARRRTDLARRRARHHGRDHVDPRRALGFLPRELFPDARSRHRRGARTQLHRQLSSAADGFAGRLLAEFPEYLADRPEPDPRSCARHHRPRQPRSDLGARLQSRRRPARAARRSRRDR